MEKRSPRELLDEFLTQNPKEWEWETKGAHAYYVKDFIRWLEKEGFELSDLDAVRMRRFIQFLVKRKYHHERRWHIRLGVFRFLEWVHKNDYPIRDPRELLPYQKPRSNLIPVELPAYTQNFLNYVSTVVKPSTLSTYRTACKHFHQFLDLRKMPIGDVDRRAMEDFFKFLSDKAQRPTTRLSNILVIRKYLAWLRERKLISGQPFKMVRSEDLPRIPDFLPRPLPPAIDRLIQKRLAASEDRSHRALLLMRYTGVRIGELARLPFDCIHTDLNKYKFLKVPLGKLDNERLVPIDEKTERIIRSIQDQTKKRLKGMEPVYLLSEKTLKAPATYILMNAFREIYEDIKSDTPINSHRLRHTYATELLSAGINICALKGLLGHRDIRMTLRYAAVTQEKVRTEYFAALEKMKQTLRADASPLEEPVNRGNYTRILADLVLELRKKAPGKGVSKNQIFHLTKRIQRLSNEIQHLV